MWISPMSYVSRWPCGISRTSSGSPKGRRWSSPSAPHNSAFTLAYDAWASSMPSLLHRLGSDVGSEVRRRRSADRRRRHQEPGGCDHHPPRPGQTVRGPWGTARTDLPAELRRATWIPEHAGTIPAALEEDQQDLSRDLPDPHELRDANVHIAPAITLPFLLTASTRWCESNDEDSVICRCTWSTSLRCGTPTWPASSATRSRAARSPRTAAWEV
jgi:hypothetical protein